MKRTTKSLIALLVLVAMCVSFCVPTFAAAADEPHEHTDGGADTVECPVVAAGEKHTKDNCKYDVVETVVASCGQDGYTEAKCKACGTTFIFGVDPKPQDHDWINDGEATLPKCEKTETGYKLVDGKQPKKCDICEMTSAEYFEKTGVDVEKIAATEENAHAWGDPYKVGDTPCTEGGTYTEKKCTVCEKTEIVGTIDAQPEHGWKLVETVLPVCCENGLSTFECEFCGETKTIVVYADRTEHDWPEVSADNTTVAPTHNTKGSATLTCKTLGCGETKTVELETIDHTWTDVEAKAAECEAEGWHAYKTCTCGKIADANENIIDAIPKIEALDHDYQYDYETGDCESATKKITTCSKCDYNAEEFVDANEDGVIDEKDYVHSYATEPTAVVEATCKTYGYKFYACILCDDAEVKSEQIEKLPHNFDEENENGTNIVYRSEGSCTEDKVFYYTCINEIKGIVCGAASEDHVEEAKDHVWAYEEVKATCVEEGYKAQWCSVCDPTKATTYEVIDTYEINPDYHACTEDGSLAVRETTPATCTTAGEKFSYCPDCNDFEIETLPVLDHDWKDVEGTRVEADCLTQGSVEQYCARNCGIENRILPLGSGDGHVYVEIDRTPATCTTKEIITYGCKNCATVDGENIIYNETYSEGGEPQDAHSYTIMVGTVLPNCEGQKAGWNVECEVCHNVKFQENTDPAAAFDPMNPDHHVAGELVHGVGVDGSDYLIKGTCQVVGQYQYKCASCDAEYRVTANDGSGKGHDADKIEKIVLDEAIEPTCWREGFTEHYKCKFCDYEVFATSRGFADHDWENHDEQPATCTDSGVEAGRTCKVPECLKKEGYATIEPLDHKFENYVANGDANCISVGTKTAECERCDATDTVDGDAVDATKHNFVTYVSNDDATCLDDGTKTALCDRCSEPNTIADEGSALGHIWSDDPDHERNEKVTATCTTDGYVIYNCLRCDDEDRNEANDRQKIGSYIDAKGHDYKPVAAIPKDCTTVGYTAGTQCECGEYGVEPQPLGTEKGAHTKGGVAISETCVAGNPDLTPVMCDVCNTLVEKTHANYFEDTVEADCYRDGYDIAMCTTCGYKVIDNLQPKLEHNYSVQKTAEGKEPAVGVTGLAYMHCEHCDAPDLDNPITLPAFGGLEFIYEIANANGGSVIANSNTVKVTVKTNATATLVNSITLKLGYNTSVLKFAGYEFVNSTNNEGGKFGEYIVTGKDGVATIYANADANGNANVTLNEEETLVVLTFVVLDDAYGKTIEITPDAASEIWTYDEETAEAVEIELDSFGAGVTANVVKLGKLAAGSAEELNSADVIELVEISKTFNENDPTTYDAQADINKDGVIDLIDAYYIKLLIANVITYEDLCKAQPEA